MWIFLLVGWLLGIANACFSCIIGLGSVGHTSCLWVALGVPLSLMFSFGCAVAALEIYARTPA